MLSKRFLENGREISYTLGFTQGVVNVQSDEMCEDSNKELRF